MQGGEDSHDQRYDSRPTRITQRRILLVAAAGNDSTDVGSSTPAAYSTVMAISATNDSDALASFSNVGDEIELAAPGVTIYSTYAGGGYDTLSGTSMACPHVSGAGGLLMTQGRPIPKPDRHSQKRQKTSE